MNTDTRIIKTKIQVYLLAHYPGMYISRPAKVGLPYPSHQPRKHVPTSLAKALSPLCHSQPHPHPMSRFVIAQCVFFVELLLSEMT